MTQHQRRTVVTGMGINTAIGDDLNVFYRNLLEGRSAITQWKFVDTSRIHSKVGGDLSSYDAPDKLKRLAPHLPEEVFRRLRRLVTKGTFSTRLSLLCAADAMIDAGLGRAELEPTRVGVLLGGHNIHNNLFYTNIVQFAEEPEYIEPMLALLSLDTDIAASVSEALGFRGPTYTLGGACASGNVGLRAAVDEIRHHDCDVIVVVGAPLDFCPVDLHAMAIMGAITYQSFNEAPARASRPYDKHREGFVPAHGAGVIVLEELEHARRRGATIHAELLDVGISSDACHLPTPSVAGQMRAMTQALQAAGVAPEEVDFISAHATSTPLGDLTEIRSLKEVFGAHAKRLKINAPKSMLGHCCWSAPLVETVAALLQMRGGKLHPSINVDDLDPEVDLDVCAGRVVDHDIQCFMKDSFGFGGINCCALFSRYSEENKLGRRV